MVYKIVKTGWAALVFFRKALMVWLISTPITFAYADDIVILNKPVSEKDTRYHYTYDLMQLIFTATEKEYGQGIISLSSSRMTRNRIFNELKKGKLINVMAEAPKKHWDDELIAIRIPIRKGIQGFRVFIIKEKYKAAFSAIDSVADLARYPTGSGRLWSTITAMEAAGLNVVKGTSYDGLFTMLSNERFISFGRGINEAYQEVATYNPKYRDLMVDNHVLLHIPLATFFYVSPQSPKLAKRIKEGLEAIIANGQFDRLFYQYHCKDLLKSQTHNRKIFRIDNPLISASLWQDLQEKNYLYSPEVDITERCHQLNIF